jgi:hypothetical protein
MAGKSRGRALQCQVFGFRQLADGFGPAHAGIEELSGAENKAKLGQPAPLDEFPLAD